MRLNPTPARPNVAVPKPHAGVRRFMDAVGQFIGGGDTVDLSSVDGVYRPETATEAPKSAVPKVEQATEVLPIRLYDGRARAVLSWPPPRGQRIDTRA